MTNLRLPPGAPPVPNPLVKVFTVNAESGEIILAMVRVAHGRHSARFFRQATIMEWALPGMWDRVPLTAVQCCQQVSM